MEVEVAPDGAARAANLSRQGELTQLLQAWQEGDAEALERLIGLAYDELRRIADAHLRRERPAHTLQPTALVHEAFLRLAGRSRLHVESRVQFYAIVAQAMRRVLIDHARRRRALRRGAEPLAVTLENLADRGRDTDVQALDSALAKLDALDPRQARVVELRGLAGLRIDETALALGLSPSTVQREWRMAKAWLARELRRSP